MVISLERVLQLRFPRSLSSLTVGSMMTKVLRIGLGVSLAASPCVAGETKRSARQAMVERIEWTVRLREPTADNAQLKRVLAAMRRVRREDFVRTADRGQAYGDTPLSIGYDQTISAAYTVAIMTVAADLPADANVLDIGTGSGYQAAVLSALGARVTSIEIVAPLADEARERLAKLGYRNVEVRSGDGYLGAPDRAQFDAIIVAAGAGEVPKPLLDQAKIGGRIIMPIGATWATEQLLIITKTGANSFDRCSLGWTMFVPLTGRGERSEKSFGVFNHDIRNCYAQPLVEPTFVRATPMK